MTVATRAQRVDAAAEPEAFALLSESSLAVEENPERFMVLLRNAPVEQLRLFAPRLLELLRVRTFGLERLEGVTPREVAVHAVLRAGYPWALELEPDDLAFVREEQAASRRARRRSFLRRLVPLGLALVGVGFVVSGFLRVVAARSSENPVRAVEMRSVTLYPPGHGLARRVVEPVTTADLEVPAVAELVPDADHALLLQASMERLVARGHHAEALAVGLDCLALSGVDERPCAMGLMNALREVARNPDALPVRDASETIPPGAIIQPAVDRSGTRELSDALFFFSEAPRAASVRRTTRLTMAALRLLAKDGASLTGTSESMARDAKARFARGEFASALDLAERCVGSFAADLDCLSVAASALPLANAARPAADRSAREAAVAESFEGYRRQMARVLAHTARERCEAQPAGTDESRPIACP